MNYKSAYDMVMELQQLLINELLSPAATYLPDSPHIGVVPVPKEKVKALSATYELQEFLADRVDEQGAQAIAENERPKQFPDDSNPEGGEVDPIFLRGLVELMDEAGDFQDAGDEDL